MKLKFIFPIFLCCLLISGCTSNRVLNGTIVGAIASGVTDKKGKKKKEEVVKGMVVGGVVGGVAVYLYDELNSRDKEIIKKGARDSGKKAHWTSTNPKIGKLEATYKKTNTPGCYDTTVSAKSNSDYVPYTSRVCIDQKGEAHYD